MKPNPNPKRKHEHKRIKPVTSKVWRTTTAIKAKAAKARVEPSTTRILNLKHSTRLLRRYWNNTSHSILIKSCHGSRHRLEPLSLSWYFNHVLSNEVLIFQKMSNSLWFSTKFLFIFTGLLGFSSKSLYPESMTAAILMFTLPKRKGLLECLYACQQWRF